MAKKLSIMQIVIIAILFLAAFSSFGQNRISLAVQGGTNFSRPVAIPESLTRDGGNYYQVTYLPGYALAGLVQFKLTPQIAIITGAGYKNLNFHFTKVFKPAYYEKSRFLAKLNYYTIPIECRLRLTQSSNFFLLIGSELAWLVRDINHELIFGRENSNEAQLSSGNVYKWFKPKNNFLTLGGGFQINPKSVIIVQTGFTLERVDQPEVVLEGDYDGSGFFFSKKLAELRFSLQYNFF